MYYFLLVDHKADFIPRAGQSDPFFEPPILKKSFPTREKHLLSLVTQCTIFVPAGHKVHFIDPCQANISIFRLPSRKKSCTTREKHIFSLVAYCTIF